jgi:hypothetical protein
MSRRKKPRLPPVRHTRKPLPALCDYGSTALEKKLLLYMHGKAIHKFELRYPDRTLYSEEDLPALLGDYTFIPSYEMAIRIFLFQYKQDQVKVLRHLSTITKQGAIPEKKKRKSRANKRRLK